uniref:Uncharacterized protein n=1 Tax=Rhizophora mucronata TaxID=61149 RepID=A0A2P2IX26_RHIMU
MYAMLSFYINWVYLITSLVPPHSTSFLLGRCNMLTCGKQVQVAEPK